MICTSPNSSPQRASAKEISASTSVNKMRLHRTKSLVELRKSKKNEKLMEKRVNYNSEANFFSIKEPQSREHDCSNQTALKLILDQCNSDDKATVLIGIESLRKQISSNTSGENLNSIINSGFLNVIKTLLAENENDFNIVYNALWSLTNISSGSHLHCQAIAEKGLLPKIIELLFCDTISIVDQALWTVSNMAGDCSEYRDQILSYPNISRALEAQIERSKYQEKYIQNIPWFISNLTRYKTPSPPIEFIKPLVKIIKMIVDLGYKSTHLDCLWTLCYITQHSEHFLEAIVENNLHEFIFKMINMSNHEVLKPAIRSIGNFAFSVDKYAEILINFNFAKYLDSLLCTNDPVIVKDTIWIVSNLAAGASDHCDHIFLPNLIKLRCLPQFDCTRDNIKISFELTYLIFNLLNSHHCLEALDLFSDDYVLEKMSYFLQIPDSEMNMIVLKTLRSLFELSGLAKTNLQERLLIAFESYDGLERVEKLQDHPNEKIYKAAYNLISDFFNDDEENEKENGLRIDLGGCNSKLDQINSTVESNRYEF